MNASATLSYLVGTMLDPLTWGVALFVAVTARHRSVRTRVLVSVVVVLLAGALIVMAIEPTDPLSFVITRLAYSGVATAIWAFLFAWVAGLMRRRRIN